MSSEIIICPYCKSEIDLNYGDKWAINEFTVISETACKCKKKIVETEKILDKAFTILKQQGILK